MATAAADQSEQHNEILQCSICMETFTDPRALPCLHTFCLQCISDWCKDKQQIKDLVACPECGQEFSIPDSGINGLKKNFFIGNLLSISGANHKTKELCEVCVGEKEAVSEMFCLQCEQSYCKSCSRAHGRMKISSSHEFVSLDVVKDDVKSVDIHKNSLFCEIHKDKQLELYCLEDEVVICSMCCFLEHRTHHCKELKKVAQDFRSGKLKQDLQTAKIVIDKNVRVFNSRSLNFFDQVKNVQTEICEETDKAVELIENHKQKLIIELQEVVTKYEKQIETVTREFAQAKTGLTLFTKYCDKLSKDGSDLDICRELGNLKKQAGELANIKDLEDILKNSGVPNIIFSPVNMTSDDKKYILGLLKTELINEPTTVISETPVDEIQVTVAASNLLDEDKGIISVALANNELFVARREVRRVSVYDSSTLQLTRTITIPGDVRDELRGMAACSFNTLLFVADRAFSASCVHRTDLSSPIYNFSNWKVPGCPYGLSITSKYNILVVLDILSTCKVREYTPTGSVLREISDSNYLYQAVETKEGTLLATRCYPMHGIVEYTWNGQILRCYGNKAGSGANQMTEPRSLAVTSDGNVLVADSGNKRIQLLDSASESARTLEIPADIKLKSPQALCYDESRGRLYVGEFGGENRLLVIDHVTNVTLSAGYLV